MRPDPFALALQQLTRPQQRRKWETPADLATQLIPGFTRTPALNTINTELVRLLDEPGGRLIVSLPPQQGKSTLVSQVFPVWALTQNPDRPIIVASYGEQLAERNGETIRDHIAWNPELVGINIADGSSSKKRWRIAGHRGGVLSAGIGSGMTGWASGLTIIDDPIKDRTEADSPTYRERVWNWFSSVALTRLAPGAPVIVVLTRWHQDDLAGRLLAAPDSHRWRVVNIPAQNDDGTYMQSARLIEDPVTGADRPMTETETAEYWEQIKVSVGPRTWQALYQGRPSPAEGHIFRRDRWQRYDQAPWLETNNGVRGVKGGRLIQSWDLAFKGTNTSDFVVGQVWWQKDVAEFWLLDQVRGRWTFSETCDQIINLSARWPQATAKLVEDKANGPAVIDALRHRLPGLIPVNPQGGKEARASAVEPFVAAGNVHLPTAKLAPWVSDLIEEAAAFPNATNDDQVDALTQALTHLAVTQPKQRTGTRFYNIG